MKTDRSSEDSALFGWFHATNFCQSCMGNFTVNGCRLAGIGFGLGTQLLFVWTAIQLFLFLRYTHEGPWHQGGLVGDVGLALGFVLPHSLLLVPAVQKQLKRLVPAGMIGCIHCCMTCLTLLLLTRCWATSHWILWKASGIWELVILGGFYGSWVALLYSISLTGFGYQTGFTQWWYWFTQKTAPRREFVVRGAYRWMRHPIYMSFLGLIWFTPVMSLDHVVLTIVWTFYIYLGSYLKDRRLLRYLGAEYREYATHVPGLPWIGFGPLGKMPQSGLKKVSGTLR